MWLLTSRACFRQIASKEKYWHCNVPECSAIASDSSIYYLDIWGVSIKITKNGGFIFKYFFDSKAVFDDLQMPIRFGNVTSP